MYNNPTAEIRPELSALVEEAAFADSYFIGLKVFPVYNSPRNTGEFRKIVMSTSELLKAGDTTRAPKGTYGEVDRTYEKDNFLCVDRGLKESIDDAAAAVVADTFDMESVSSKLLLRRIMLGHESRVAAKVQDPSNFDAFDAVEDYTNANKDTIDFAQDMQLALKRVKQRGEIANTIILNRDLFDRIRTSTLFAKFLFGPLGGGQQITQDMLGTAFGIKNVLIADATLDTAKKGQAASLSYIWTPGVIWVGNVQGGDFSAGGAGRTIVWTGDTGGSTFVTETYRHEDTRCDVIRVRSNTDEKVISKPAGTLITTNYA